MNKLLILSAVLSVVLAIVGCIVWRSQEPYEPLRLDESARVEACEHRLQGLLKVAEVPSETSPARPGVMTQSAELALLSNIASACYTEIDEQDTLSEAGIRRLAFLNQQHALLVLMWMVIAVTLSGVGLACLQLLASYQLALQGRATLEQRSELSLEASKLSTTSSVSGV